MQKITAMGKSEFWLGFKSRFEYFWEWFDGTKIERVKRRLGFDPLVFATQLKGWGFGGWIVCSWSPVILYDSLEGHSSLRRCQVDRCPLSLTFVINMPVETDWIPRLSSLCRCGLKCCTVRSSDMESPASCCRNTHTISLLCLNLWAFQKTIGSQC